jgi:hypothetical protein
MRRLGSDLCPRGLLHDPMTGSAWRSRFAAHSLSHIGGGFLPRPIQAGGCTSPLLEPRVMDAHGRVVDFTVDVYGGVLRVATTGSDP